MRESSKAAKAHRAKQKSHTVARTYRVSIIEGVFAQIYGALANIGSNFITKFLVLLGASPLHFSILSALGQLSALFQPLGVALTYRPRQRKKLCVWITAAGRFLSIFIGSALLFSEARQGIAFVLALLFVSAGLQAVGGNIWIAWISDIIPAAIRGRFFARRNQILVFSGLLAGYLLSYLTDSFEKGGGALRSFAARWVNPNAFFTIRNQSFWLAGVFVFASILGLAGLVILARQPDRKRSQQQVLPLRQKFGEPFRDKNFRLLMAFGIWWMLATGVGSAFWTPFMLKNLGLSMFQLQLYGSLHMISSLLSYSFWGKFIDRWGNKPAMLICVILGGLNPMLWLFMTRQNYSLLWIEGLFSGFMWAGNGVATTNFVLAIAGKGREQSYSALYGAIGGVSMMATTLLSGVFYPQPMMLGSRLLASEQVIFGVGGILRWLSVIPLMAVNEKRSSIFQSPRSGH